MAMTIYLLDKSAAAPRLGPAAASRRESLAIRGQLSVCAITAMELLYSARDLAQYRAIESALQAYRWLGTTEEVMQRALQVQSLLAERGGLHHRRPLPDLIIAATAELNGATVLHNDKDYEIIAEVTGQPVERIEQSTGLTGEEISLRGPRLA